MSDTPERKRPFRNRTPGAGRPSKGARYTRTIRFPVDLNEAIEDAALAAGYDNVNDCVVEIVERARAAGLFPTAAPGQGRLPISA
jgi:hypothetical protein